VRAFGLSTRANSSRKSATSIKILAVLVSVCLGPRVAALAWDLGGSRSASSSSVVAASSVAVSSDFDRDLTIEPWIHNNVAPDVRAKLETGFELAVERVLEVESCRELFTRLGADPIIILETGLYFQVVSYYREIELCGRNVAANSRRADNLSYTKVGGTPTWICRNFASVSDEVASITVIHEALHHAGLTESPSDKTAMSSVEITDMVRKACGFGGRR
jgi:hypothetical protein